MTRAEIIDVIVRKAHEHGLDPAEFLGGAIAESALDPTAWRQGDWPDWSAGLFQQTVRFADEGDQSASAENVALIKRLYFDPAYASDVAARKFKAYRAREATALDAWSRYNSPNLAPIRNPNRANYQDGLDQAYRILGANPMPVTFDPNTPPIPQDDPWSCAPTSTRWAMTALGRHPGPTYIEDLMLRDGIVTQADGLLDATGGQLAAWIGKPGPEYYGDDGFYGNNEPLVSFDWCALEGDHAYPLLIGGRRWGHWSALRGFDAANGLLLLANPAPNWMGVGQTMDRSTFDALGPFSAVRVLHPDLLAPAPVPPLPPTPPVEDTRLARARFKLQEALTILEEAAP